MSSHLQDGTDEREVVEPAARTWLALRALIGQAARVTTTKNADGFGIDIGGSGIKGAPVDLTAGEFAADRLRIETPERSTPGNVVEVVLDVLAEFDWRGPFGCTFPGVIQHGIVHTAAHLDKSWIGYDLAHELGERTGQRVTVVNDADAAGVAEDRFGAAADVDGVVIVTTLGTGIGSAVLHDGTLLPNTEFGHLYLAGGHEAEHRAAASVREGKDLSWEAWAERLQEFYAHVELVFSPPISSSSAAASARRRTSSCRC